MRKITVLDTTLRDGEQAPGNSMLPSEKVEIAHQLKKLGVSVIEAGFAAASLADADSVKQIAESVRGCTVCTLSRCKKEDIDVSYDALKNAERSRLHLFLAVSPVHMQYKLQMNEEQVLEKIKESVSYATNKFDEIQFSMEDATRSERSFLYRAIECASAAGATVINLPDTVGYSYPDEIRSLFTDVTSRFPNVTFAAHCHNDLGMAVANTLAAIEGGATQVECTVNGIGERAGNAALEEVVMALKTRPDHFLADTDINTKQIFSISQSLSAVLGVKPSPTKPIVGKNAFMHESGIHQHGVLANPLTYEIIKPSDVGIIQNEIVLGKHSGKHALAEYLSEMDIEVTPDRLNDLFVRFKALASKKKNITYKDIMYLISHGRNFSDTHRYTASGYTIISVKGNRAVATVKLMTEDGSLKIDEETGDGPLDAAFKTINHIIGKDFKLLDWSNNAITEGEDALAVASLRLSLNGIEVTGRAVSTDTVESSLLAYLNACNKLLQRTE